MTTWILRTRYQSTYLIILCLIITNGVDFYPGFTGFETRRIVDEYSDVKETVDDSKLIKLNRSFICYHLFENHEFPEIKPVLSTDKRFELVYSIVATSILPLF